MIRTHRDEPVKRRRGGPVGLLGLLWAILPLQAVAQGEVGLNLGFGTFTGPDFTESRAGRTIGVRVSFPFLGSLQAGFAFDHSIYGAGGLEGDTKQLDYLAVARHVQTHGPVRLVAGGKMGLSRQRFTITDEPATTQGFVVGPTAGLQLWLSGIALEITADGLYHSYEEYILYTRRQHGTDEDGFRFVIRTGVVIPFGGR